MADARVPIVCLKTIFSLAARERCITNLLKNVTAPRYGKVPTETTAVLVPVCKVADVPSLLYTVRSPKPKSNTGEIAFPGGRTDIGEDAVQTVLKETFDEIGLPQCKIDVWGKGVAVPERNNKVITPVIGSIDNFQLSELKINNKDVSDAFTIPIEMFCEPKNQFYTQFSNGFVLPVYVIENYTIWGITAYITHTFLSSILTKDHYSNDWMNKKVDLDPNKMIDIL